MIYVALLRGINVGGNNRVEMSRLKKILEGLGYSDVSTYINSGNAFFKTPESDPRKIEINIEQAIENEFKLNLHVVIRSLPEIKELIKAIPPHWLKASDKKCNVIFLRHNIDNRDILDNFSPKEGIEELSYHPGTLLWSANTSDLTRSEMIQLAKNGLYKDMTIRNLNTTRKIYEIMSSLLS